MGVLIKANLIRASRLVCPNLYVAVDDKWLSQGVGCVAARLAILWSDPLGG